MRVAVVRDGSGGSDAVLGARIARLLEDRLEEVCATCDNAARLFAPGFMLAPEGAMAEVVRATVRALPAWWELGDDSGLRELGARLVLISTDTSMGLEELTRGRDIFVNAVRPVLSADAGSEEEARRALVMVEDAVDLVRRYYIEVESALKREFFERLRRWVQEMEQPGADVLGVLVEAACDLAGASGAAARRWDAAGRGEAGEDAAAAQRVLDVLGGDLEIASHVLHQDVMRTAPAFGGLDLESGPLASCTYLPLMVEARPLGGFVVAGKRGARRFTDNDHLVFSILAGYATRTMGGTRVREQAARLAESMGRLSAPGPRVDGFPQHVLEGLAEAGDLQETCRVLMRSMVESHRERKDMETVGRRRMEARKMEAVGRLAGGMARDFNNLLTVIRGSASMMLEREQDETTREDIGLIIEASRKAADLTARLLVFSPGDVRPCEPLDLAALVGGMEEDILKLAGGRVAVQVLAGDGPATVAMDPDRVRHVVLALVHNALEAMVEGGKLSVEVRRVSVDDTMAAFLGDIEPGPHVTLAVTDTGQGMDEETASRAFEPFFTTHEERGASGLGLSEVYGIVRRAGGDVSLHSDPGRGTMVVSFLPVAPPRDGSSRRGAAAGATAGALGGLPEE